MVFDTSSKKPTLPDPISQVDIVKIFGVLVNTAKQQQIM